MMQKLQLGFYPTPLHHLPNLSNKYSDYEIYIKRDDQTGLGSGGNKVRKLEYLLKDAINQKADTIITIGSQQSNHCRQTAAACAILNLDCHLILGGYEPELLNGNALLDHLFGATFHFAGDTDREEFSNTVIEKLKNEGKKTYLIPIGGSNLVGSYGYIDAIEELMVQMKDQKLQFDYIFIASGSGGTQAGTELGILYHNMKTKLMPVRIDKGKTQGKTIQENALFIINESLTELNRPERKKLEDITMVAGYDDAGYSVVTENERTAIHELAKLEGIMLDPVYTGRAFFAMTDYLKNEKIPKNSTILFWHTGGLPTNFVFNKQIV